MTTLITAYGSDGCEGRCDACCYNAHEPHCDCVCGGCNHGAGLRQAVENTRQMAEDWVQAYTHQHHLCGVRWEVPALEPLQLDFFTEAI
ncbi:MAG: hypothetical protein QY332_10110 [Anaerolineales bacterium]|nr:MAG: hypothetical protein QY332_10110 [Anaerolineales bacterium]